MNDSGVIIGIDLSLRSTGIVVLNEREELQSFKLIQSPKKQYQSQEESIINNATEICKFIKESSYDMGYAIDGIALEGLSYGGVSGSKDVLYGNYWVLRCALYTNFKCSQTIIPVAKWRASVITPNEKRKLFEKYGKGSVSLKQGCVDKLPSYVFDKFGSYIESLKDIKKASIYDLSDAYWIAKFENTQYQLQKKMLE